MKRLILFWTLITSNRATPPAISKKINKFSIGVCLLFSITWIEPGGLAWVVISLSPYLVVFAMAFVPCVLISVIWFWWQEAGRLRAKGVDTLDEK